MHLLCKILQTNQKFQTAEKHWYHVDRFSTGYLNGVRPLPQKCRIWIRGRGGIPFLHKCAHAELTAGHFCTGGMAGPDWPDSRSWQGFGASQVWRSASVGSCGRHVSCGLQTWPKHCVFRAFCCKPGLLQPNLQFPVWGLPGRLWPEKCEDVLGPWRVLFSSHARKWLHTSTGGNLSQSYICQCLKHYQHQCLYNPRITISWYHLFVVLCGQRTVHDRSALTCSLCGRGFAAAGEVGLGIFLSFFFVLTGIFHCPISLILLAAHPWMLWVSAGQGGPCKFALAAALPEVWSLFKIWQANGPAEAERILSGPHSQVSVWPNSLSVSLWIVVAVFCRSVWIRIGLQLRVGANDTTRS